MYPSSVAGQSAKAGEILINEGFKRIIKNVNQKRRRTIHQLSLIAEAGGRCERCDETFHPFIYDFHHKNPKLKSFSLDRSVFGKSIKSLREEAKKCHLLCANCHREVHTFLDTQFLDLEGVNQEEVIYEAKPIGFKL